MPGATEAMAFTDSYKHMECLGGMRTLCLPVQRRVLFGDYLFQSTS